MNNTLIISGSSRNDGDTQKVVTVLVELTGWNMIDLNNYNISYYDYEHQNKDDDYLGLIRDIIDKYNTLVFVTPVYWYTMSGIMKVFFDRFSDLLTIEKELGRKLREKNMAVLSSSYGDNLGESFWLPFSETARYLGIHYLGHTHTIVGNDETENLKNFIKEIERSGRS